MTTLPTHPAPVPELPELPEGVDLADRAGSQRWKAWTAPVALIAGFGATIFVGLIVGIVAGAFGASLEDPPPGVNIGLTFFQDFAIIGAALLFARVVARPRAVDFGLRRPRFWKALGLLVAVWVGFYALSAAWVGALGIDEQDELPEQLGADESTLALVFVLALVVVMAPIAEEFFFRGYFFTAVRNRAGLWPAAVATGIFFGAIHAGSSPVGFLVPLAIFGVGLCLLYAWTGSLYPSIALHALNNSVAFGVTQEWTWEIPLTMGGSVLVTIALAALLGRALDRGPERATSAPALA